MNSNFSLLMRLPILFAIIFTVIDVLWLALLTVLSWGKNSGHISFRSTWWNFSDWAMMLWNQIHFPTRYFIEPILFPVVTFHPPSISSSSILIYQGLCVLQFTIIGFIIGILVQMARRKSN